MINNIVLSKNHKTLENTKTLKAHLQFYCAMCEISGFVFLDWHYN